MPHQPVIVASDLEGVLVPEIWIAVAEATGVEQLRLTTRDVADYDQLMQGRLRLLREHGLSLSKIQAVIAGIEPLPGAAEFLRWVRRHAQCVILSDTFYEFAAPLMAKLGQPTLFCNMLDIDADNMLSGYHLRQTDGKRQAVRALQQLNFRVAAIGDSYNDTAMLGAADTGILFRAPSNVVAEFPQFPVLREYQQLREQLAPLIVRPG